MSDSDFFVAGVEGLELEIAHSPTPRSNWNFKKVPSEIPTVMDMGCYLEPCSELPRVFESAPAVTEDRLWGPLVSA